MKACVAFSPATAVASAEISPADEQAILAETHGVLRRTGQPPLV